MPLPSAPHVWVESVECNSAKMFKFALYSAVLSFVVDRAKGGRDASGGHSKSIKDAKSTYEVMIKTGDDPRQDQLVIIGRYIQVLLRYSAFLTLLRYAAAATIISSPAASFSLPPTVGGRQRLGEAINAAINDAEEMELEAGDEERKAIVAERCPGSTSSD